MRPLRLIVESFTCFKDRQPPLDLENLSLFAISGPTGAGKSSLLDAMIFALYGRVPRMRKGYVELVSLGRDRLSVVLDFRLGGRDYRVTRVARRGRPGDAQLEELAGGAEKSLVGGVTGVDKQIEKLLGLGYDAFVQAVVLPQGEFARFLKSQPAERREIMRHLLRLQVYERMRERARERAVELSGLVRSREERLAQDYAGVTPEGLGELKRRVAERAQENEELKKRLEAETARVQELGRIREKTKELRANRERAEELSRWEPEMRARERRLEAGRKAAQILPLVEQALRAESEAARDAERAAETRENREQALQRHHYAREALERAARAASEAPALRARLQALDEVSGLLAPLSGARRRVERLGGERAAMEKDLAALRGIEGELSTRVRNLEQALVRLDAAAAEIGYDEGLDALLDEARESASELGQKRRTGREVEAQATAAEKQSAEKAARAAAARRELEELTHALGHAEATHREVERENLAETLRRSVALGERCPVCQQPVKKLPAARQLSLLDPSVVRFEELKKRESVARESAVQAQALATSSAEAARVAREEAERARRLFEERESELESRLGAVLAGDTGDFVEERVLSAARRMVGLRKKHRDTVEERVGLEKDLAQVRHAEASRRERADTLEQSLERAEAELKEAKEEVERLEARLSQVTTDPDPARERRRLAEQIEKLEGDLKATEKAEREAATGLAAAESVAEAAQKSAEEAARAASEAQQVGARAARDAGFESPEAAREASLSEEERVAVEQEVAQHREDCRATERRIAELESELGGREADESALRKAEAELKEIDRRREEGLKEEAGLGQQVEELSKKLQSARRLSAQLDSERREHGLYRELAEDLGSKRFQAYLLEETFRELVEGASGRLLELSGRYTLDFREESFHVLDHENAGERRNADTLSGGETFLASLALALELSEHVQRVAGAVHLDSLFIDEGFGTLDPETLDTVAAAIEMLPVGGRMVGIITHIPELTARLPARIRVEKGAESSRACLELT